MQYATPSGLVCRGLKALLMEDLQGKFEPALKHTKFLLSVELETRLQPSIITSTTTKQYTFVANMRGAALQEVVGEELGVNR